MKYSNIRIQGTSVKLEYEHELDAGGNEAATFNCDDAPAPAFRDALQAFRPFALALLGLNGSWGQSAEVRSVALKSEDGGLRGLNVTIVRKIPGAHNAPVAITTPYMRQLPEEHQGTGEGFLDDVTCKLIAQLEERADEYRDGERGEQLEAFTKKDSENAARVDDEMRAASVASTRKPKSKKLGAAARRQQTETGVPVANEAGDPMTDDLLRQLLVSVDRDVPIDAIARWTSTERDAAQRWGQARQKEIVGQLEGATVPAEPPALLRDATPRLSADDWTSPHQPPKAAGVESIAS